MWEINYLIMIDLNYSYNHVRQSLISLLATVLIVWFGCENWEDELGCDLIGLTKKENRACDLEVSEAEISKNKHIQMLK